MFPTLSYIEWIVGRLDEATHDLGSSDLSPVADDDGVVPAALRDLPDPADDGVTLEELVADEYGVEAGNVLVTAGATHANFLVAAAAMGRSEAETPHVLVEKPGYEPLVGTPQGLGARVNRFVRPADHYYELEPGRVEAAMTEDTALITATNGHNPSGRAADRDALAEIGRVAAENDAVLLVDEVYSPFVARPDGDAEGERTPIGGVSGALLPNTVVTNSLTKFHGLGGLDIGWLIADEAFVERARSVLYHLPTVAEPSRALARRALANGETLAGRSRDLAAENHALLAAFVEGRDDLSGFVAPGSTFAFPSHRRADGDAVVEAAWEAGVLVVPGRFFDDPERFRLSLGRRPEAARAGLDALGAVLDDL